MGTKSPFLIKIFILLLNINIKTLNMKAKEIYKDYDKRVQDYMQNVIDCLVQDYKVLPTSWRISLDLIAMNCDLIFKAKDDINKNGLLRTDELKRTFKNQNFQILMNAQTAIVKLLSTFGLTPVSKSKLKNFNSDNINIDDLIND